MLSGFYFEITFFDCKQDYVAREEARCVMVKFKSLLSRMIQLTQSVYLFVRKHIAILVVRWYISL
jgi:hypothetical protein